MAEARSDRVPLDRGGELDIMLIPANIPELCGKLVESRVSFI